MIPQIVVVLLCGLAWAQTGPYCGSGAFPTPSDCQDAINQIDSSSQYNGGTTISAGDCSIMAGSNPAVVEQISGSQFISAGQAIMNSCNSLGWENVATGDVQTNVRATPDPMRSSEVPSNSPVQVSVYQCQVCMYGTCSVCDAPSKRGIDVWEMDKESIQTKKAPAKKRLTKPNRFSAKQPSLKRQSSSSCQNPPNEPNIQCCSAFSAETSDCVNLGNSLMGQTLDLPYTGASGSCEVAVESSSSGTQASGGDVGTVIVNDASICNSDGIVGEVIDTGSSTYTVYFGQLCGEFGFGYDGCTE